MRREELFLRDIIEAADFVAKFMEGIDRVTFGESELIRSAVVQKLAVIGEASARLPSDFTLRYPEVPWPQIVGFRNILIHAYFGIDWNEVWQAATKEAPALRTQIEQVLQTEFGPTD